MPRAAPTPSGDAATRFETLYRACYGDLLRYALRRTERPEAAADVVADTFLVAWRRIDDIPIDQARLWLFVVARNVLANQHRAARAAGPTWPPACATSWPRSRRSAAMSARTSRPRSRRCHRPTRSCCAWRRGRG